MKRIPAAAWLAGLASAAAAQQAPAPDAANPAAIAPKPVYQSAIAGYRPWTEVKVSSWRETNEAMRRLGGHAGHVKPAAKAPVPPQKKAPK